jgi:hypothetical protein
VATDPVPDHPVCLPDGQSTITEAYASGINIVIALDFLELQARVRWICLEDSVGALGLALGIRRQIMKQTLEIPGGPGKAISCSKVEGHMRVSRS